MSDIITEIENPIYMTREEMERHYWNKCVLLTNLTKNNGKSITGGVIRYSARNSKILYNKMMELDKNPDKYGHTTVFWMGDEPGMLGGLSLSKKARNK
jgi:hypothetical protein